MALLFPATIMKLVHTLVFMSCLSLVESPENSYTTIKADNGHNVILPCQLNTTFHKNNETVTWKRNDQLVHKYQYGKDYLTNQHTNFTTRTSLFPDEMTRGNISLKLAKVTERDAGHYTCDVGAKNPGTKCNVTLTVEKKSGTNKTQTYEKSYATIMADSGHNVILPCQLNTTFHNNETVTWKLNNQTVHDYQNGKDYLTNQHTNFTTRTSLFPDEMTRGNLSLKLTKVTEQDAGHYTCDVGAKNPGTKCNVTLTVEKKSGTNETQTYGLYIGLSLGGLFIGALIGIVWKKYGNTSRCAGRDRRERNRQDRSGIQERIPMRINPDDAAL